MSIEIQNRMSALESRMDVTVAQLTQEIVDLKQTMSSLTFAVEEKLKELSQAAVERAERTGKTDGIRKGHRGKAKA